MTIYQYGDINNSALSVPGVYTEIVPPQVVNLNGVPTNFAGYVGTASWGPVNAPVKGTSAQDGARAFGPMNARLGDLSTAISIAALQGNAGSWVGVRVSDGTDTAATGSLGTNGNLSFWTALAAALNSGSGVSRGPSQLVTAVANSSSLSLTAKYTGSYGANIGVALSKGTKVGSYKLIVSAPGRLAEVFDNLAYGVGGGVNATGAIAFTVNPTATSTVVLNGTTWTFVASGATGTQVNIGGSLGATLSAFLAAVQASADTNTAKFTYALSGNTLLLTAASAGTSGNSLTIATTVTGATATGSDLLGGANSMSAPAATSVTLSGGSDGASGVTSSTLLGSDSATPRTGMYALRNQGVSAATLVDCYDSTTFTAQAALGDEEGIVFYGGGPAGDTITNAVTTKASAGVDAYSFVWVHGDWITFNDGTNNLQRKVSPTAFVVGRRVNLSPDNSVLNKPIYGVVSTETSAANLTYADADISTLYQAGIEVVSATVPGGNYFGCATGRNSSSNENTHNDAYSTMTNYIARTIDKGMGQFVGRKQSRQPTDPLRAEVWTTLDAYFTTMENLQPQGMIDDHQVICDLTNNTSTTIGNGYLFAYSKVVYMAIVEFFVAEIEGGSTVSINRAGTFTADQIGSSAYNALNATFQ